MRSSYRHTPPGCWMLLLVLLLGIVGAFLLASKRVGALAVRDRDVRATWSEVHEQYERRLQLVQRLMATPEADRLQGSDYMAGYRRMRQGLQERALPAEPRPSDLEQLEAYLDLQDRFSKGQQRWLDEIEATVPEPSEAYLAVARELAGNEVRIKLARRDYHDAVWSYNNALLGFPEVFLAKITGYRTSPRPTVRIPGEEEEEGAVARETAELLRRGGY